MAIELHRVGNLDAAEKLYEGVLSALPENPDALHFKGVLLHQRGRTEQALELISASIALNDGIPDWHYNLGNVLVETGSSMRPRMPTRAPPRSRPSAPTSSTTSACCAATSTAPPMPRPRSGAPSSSTRRIRTPISCSAD